MTDADVKLLIDTLSAAVAAGQKVSVPAERVLELHARLQVDSVKLRAYVRGLGTACALPGVRVFEEKTMRARAA